MNLTNLNIEQIGACGTFIIIIVSLAFYYAYKLCKIKCNGNNKK